MYTLYLDFIRYYLFRNLLGSGASNLNQLKHYSWVIIKIEENMERGKQKSPVLTEC